MDRENVLTVVRVTLAALARIADRTRTRADNWMVAILKGNEDRLVDAVLKALQSPEQPPTEEAIVKALESVGMRVDAPERS